MRGWKTKEWILKWQTESHGLKEEDRRLSDRIKRWQAAEWKKEERWQTYGWQKCEKLLDDWIKRWLAVGWQKETWQLRPKEERLASAAKQKLGWQTTAEWQKTERRAAAELTENTCMTEDKRQAAAEWQEIQWQTDKNDKITSNRMAEGQSGVPCQFQKNQSLTNEPTWHKSYSGFD